MSSAYLERGHRVFFDHSWNPLRSQMVFKGSLTFKQSLNGVFRIARELYMESYSFSLNNFILFFSACFCCIASKNPTTFSKLIATTNRILLKFQPNFLNPISPGNVHMCDGTPSQTKLTFVWGAIAPSILG